MKKIIVGTLAVIGGVSVVLLVVGGITVAVQNARNKKKLANMTPKEREAQKKNIDAMITAFMAIYGAAEEKPAEMPEVEEVTA